MIISTVSPNYITAAIALLMIVVSIPLALRESPPRSTVYFGISFLLLAVAVLTNVEWFVGDAWPRILQNTLFCAALISLCCGLWLRAGYPPDRVLFTLVALIWIVPNIVFSVWIPNAVLRFLAFSVASVVALSSSAWRLYHKKSAKNTGDWLLLGWHGMILLLPASIAVVMLVHPDADRAQVQAAYLSVLPVAFAAFGLFLFESIALDSIGEMERQARTDALTGLMNRRAFDEELTATIALAKRYKRPLAIVMTDIDHFKVINDRYGHPFGDRVIRDFAHMLREETREVDLVARIGGEEFAVVMPEIDVAQAALFAERLRRASEKLVIRDVGLTASFGVSDTAHCDYSGSALIQDADAALYRAKQNGRNRVEVAGVLGAPLREAKPPA